MITDIHIILASGSPRRKELLERAGYNFEVKVSDASEDINGKIPEPKDFVIELARRKAGDVSEKEIACRLRNDDKTPFIVIGADTVVALDDKILGKPKDKADAANMLQSLSGRSHHVYTGVSLVYYDGEKTRDKCFYECTEVVFYPMTDEEISWYVATGEPLDKAGSYGIQGKGGLFVKEICGDYNNVVGLPIARLYHEIILLGEKADG